MRARTDHAWVFGYGSLLWKADFPYAERVPGRIHGWARRFWQASVDHRGTPAAPGRVVTLVREPNRSCCGAAYRLAPETERSVLAHLDHREKGGYDRVQVVVHTGCKRRRLHAVVYVAHAGNPNYVGAAPLPEIAEQVRRSTGPSGDNTTYVLRLAQALRELGADDEHVFALERLVRWRSILALRSF